MNESTELATINENSLKSQKDWINKRDKNLVNAKAITEVNDQEQLEAAGKIESEAKKLIKALGEERLKLTRPLDAIKKALTDAEKEMTSALDKESSRINGLMSAYATKQLLAAREAQRQREKADREAAEAAAAAEAKAEEEAAESDPFAPEAELPTPPHTPPLVKVNIPYVERPTASTNSFTLVTKFEVEDPSKVAREFLSVDESKIREFLAYRKKMGDDMEKVFIAGIKIWQESQVKTR